MALFVKIEMLTVLAYCAFNMVIATYLAISEKSINKLIDDNYTGWARAIIIILALPNVIVMEVIEAVMKRGTK